MIIADARIPVQAKERLNKIDELIDFKTEGITYDAISGHPDIFFCQVDNQLIVAPNVPEEYIQRLQIKGIRFQFGQQEVGHRYPASAFYNAVSTEFDLIHRVDMTEPAILQNSSGKHKIPVKQGYTRCNLLPLGKNCFLTSDKGIQVALEKAGKTSLYVNSKDIRLPGFSHGFLGGACGIRKNKVFIIGSLKYLADGEAVRLFIGDSGLDIVELYDGPLFDGGSLLFLDRF